MSPAAAVTVAPSIMQGNTDTRYYHNLTHNIIRFGPSSIKPDKTGLGTLTGVHTVNEHYPIQGLADAERMEEAEALRAPVERIVLTPANGGDHLTIDLEGALAALLRLATGRHAQTAPSRRNEAADAIGESVLVAGTGFGLNRTSGQLRASARRP